MDPLEAHQRAQDTFAVVLANVRPDQLSLPSPCTEWTVLGVIEHVIGGNGWVQVRAGLEPVPVPEGSAHLSEALAISAGAAQAVFAAPDGLTRTFELPFGALPGAAFVGIRSGDVLAHAWDVAKATGQDTNLAPDLAEQLIGTTRAFLTPALRGEGRPFGPEQPCPDGASPADEYAAFLGRTV